MNSAVKESERLIVERDGQLSFGILESRRELSGHTSLEQVDLLDISIEDLKIGPRVAEGVVIRKLLFDLVNIENLAKHEMCNILRHEDRSFLSSEELKQAEAKLAADIKKVAELPESLRLETEIEAGIFPEGTWRAKARQSKIESLFEEQKSDVFLPRDWSPDTERVFKVELPSGLKVLGYSRAIDNLVFGAVMLESADLSKGDRVLSFISPLGESSVKPRFIGSRSFVAGDLSQVSDRVKFLKIQTHIDRLHRKFHLKQIQLAD